ncbi:zinc ribbon domain-containing protein [Burkholderia multivorans]|nr:zinc ribbon domain-containing protein [Burkholderia multivorans]MBU9235541.1 zinc ribbon domain-containing protein [Burkholderia multivorans]QGR93804.1 zinc ribbon domain-containing protein [Burkholderia multivorans]HEF4737189.1 zinc ribbon domain-containing protein [Burkholderia multivorans]
MDWLKRLLRGHGDGHRATHADGGHHGRDRRGGHGGHRAADEHHGWGRGAAHRADTHAPPRDVSCATCGAPNAAGARDCIRCGSVQRGRACVRCEATLPADAHFCPACGTRADAG